LTGTINDIFTYVNDNLHLREFMYANMKQTLKAKKTKRRKEKENDSALDRGGTKR